MPHRPEASRALKSLWSEDELERFLSRCPGDVITLLSGTKPGKSPAVLRQLADLDLVLRDGDDALYAFELKKTNKDPARAASQLARNLPRALEALSSGSQTRVIPVLVGSWSPGVLEGLANRRAWSLLHERYDTPRIVVAEHSLAGREQVLRLSTTTLRAAAFDRGERNSSPRTAATRDVRDLQASLRTHLQGTRPLRRYKRKLTDGLTLRVHLFGSTVAVRLQLRAKGRDSWLGARLAEDGSSTFSGKDRRVAQTFEAIRQLRIQAATAFRREFHLGQRLELVWFAADGWSADDVLDLAGDLARLVAAVRT